MRLNCIVPFRVRMGLGRALNWPLFHSSARAYSINLFTVIKSFFLSTCFPFISYFIYSFVHSSANSFIRSFIHSLFIHPPIHSSTHSFIHPFIHPPIHSSTHSFIHTSPYRCRRRRRRQVSESLLSLYLREYEDPPWDALKYLIAGVMYGGHVTDDWDRRLLMTYINQMFNEDVLNVTYYKWVIGGRGRVGKRWFRGGGDKVVVVAAQGVRRGGGIFCRCSSSWRISDTSTSCPYVRKIIIGSACVIHTRRS